jgi:thiol-disulfide isomerase/thioredoxin
VSIDTQMPSLAGATGWLNSEALAPADLRGRVVLVDFWTYTCINWLRTLPYLRAWNRRYAGQPFVLVGVHTPEFGFEGDVDNIRREAGRLGVDYPIAVDPDYTVWRAFDNHYWPALYFADADGRIRHRHFGEGDYESSELIIQQLLAEAGGADSGLEPVSVDAPGIEAPADWETLRTPETYLGYLRAERQAPRASDLRLNQWALAGDWDVGGQAVALRKPGGVISVRFQARDVHLILAPPPGGAARFRVRLDGRAPGDDHGLDVDAQGAATVSEPRLHQLVRQRGPIVERTIEIEFPDAGVEAYCFTFG